MKTQQTPDTPPTGQITVVFGGRSLTLDMAGSTVTQIRKFLEGIIPRGARPEIGRKQVEHDYRVKQGETLVFRSQGEVNADKKLQPRHPDPFSD